MYSTGYSCVAIFCVEIKKVMQRAQGQAGNPVAVGNVLQQIQRVLQQQPRVGPLVSIGGPTVLAGGATVSSPNIQSSQPPAKNPSYTYKVKIINPNKKSDISVRHLHECSTKFESVVALRIKLIESFKESVPNTVDFNVGYYEGSQQAKIWLVVPDDLKKMYERYAQGGAITLWCDGRSDDDNEHSVRKRKRDSETSKKHSIEENERDVEEVYKQLLEKHSSKWDSPRLRLWARCICTEHHSSYEDPPDLPAFKEPETKKRKESLTEALAGAAVAFASAMSGSSQNQVCRSAHLESGPSVSAVSPGKTVELRIKKL